MAELASNNITVTLVANTLGVSPVQDVLIRDHLCNASNINKWSFYRPRPIQVNATTKLVELATAPTTDRKLGDFRRYNHTALTPDTAADYTQNWGPGGSTFTVTLATYIERLNVKELVPSTTMYWTVDYYLSSANRAAKTSRQRRYTTLLSLTTETPPTGHTNNQTQAPASSFQLIVDTGVPTALLTTPDDVLYIDTYISDLSSNELIRFDDSYTDVSTHELAHPYVDAYAPNITPVPAGYTTVYPVVTNSSSNYLGTDYTETQGATTYGTFYWFLAGLKGSTWYRLGSVAVTAQLKIYNPEGGSLKNTTTIFNSTLNAAGASSNQSAAGTLASSYSWAYDDVGDVIVTVPSWTGYTEYALAGTP